MAMTAKLRPVDIYLNSLDHRPVQQLQAQRLLPSTELRPNRRMLLVILALQSPQKLESGTFHFVTSFVAGFVLASNGQHPCVIEWCQRRYAATPLIDNTSVIGWVGEA